MDPSGTAQIKAATKIQSGDHGCHPGHWLFKEIQLVQVTGDLPVAVTHPSDSPEPQGQAGRSAYSDPQNPLG